jgi:hypothetical protein
VNDVIEPSNYMKQIILAGFWAANAGVLDSLHQDSYDNMISVIKGKLRVTLIPQDWYSELYPKSDLNYLLIASQVKLCILINLINTYNFFAD